MKQFIVTRENTDFSETMVAFVIRAEEARIQAAAARESGDIDKAAELEWLDAECMVIATQYAAVVNAQSSYAIAQESGSKF